MIRQNSPRCWGMFAVLVACGMTVGFSQLKITPVMAQVANLLGVTVTDAAWLTSVFTLAGILLSVPGGSIIGRLGPKRSLVFMLAMLVAGNALGAVAMSFPLMMASRVIEGIAAIFALPVGIELINRWFTGPNVGVATGAFMAATPVATFLMTGFGLTVAEVAGSIKSLWWIIAALDVICIVVVLFAVQVPERELDVPALSAHRSVLADVREVASVPALSLLCVAMFFLTFCLYSLITCYPQLFAFYGLPDETSNLLTSLNGLVGIPMSVLAGVIIGKTGKPYLVALVGAVGAFVTCATLPYLSEGTYAANVICSAVFPGGVGMAPLFVLAPLLVRRSELAPMATCLMNTFFYLGQFVSTPVTTALSAGNTTWMAPSLVLSAACLAQFLFLFLSMRKLNAEAGNPAVAA